MSTERQADKEPITSNSTPIGRLLLTPPVFSRRLDVAGCSRFVYRLGRMLYLLLLLLLFWKGFGNRLGTAFRLFGRSISPLVASTIIRRNESTRQTIQSADPTLTVHLFLRSSTCLRKIAKCLAYFDKKENQATTAHYSNLVRVSGPKSDAL